MSVCKTLKGLGWVAISLLMIVGIVIYFETVPQYARKHSRLFIRVDPPRNATPIDDDFWQNMFPTKEGKSLR